MIGFKLSKPQRKMNFLKKLIAILLVCCCCFIQESRAETFNNVLKYECSLNYGNGLQKQIIDLSKELYTCISFSDDVKDYIKHYDNLSEDKKNVYQIYSYFQNNPENLTIIYRTTGLIQYLLYKKFSEQTSSCGDKVNAKRLGSYDKCLYCVGSSECYKQSGQLFTEVSELYPIPKPGTEKRSSLNTANVYILSFQILWNCNKPDDQLEITGIYDEVTENKLLQTDVNGFENVCWNCKVQNCAVCTKNYRQCISCKDGYFLKNNECNQCSLSNCSKCTYDSSKDSELCSACQKGFQLVQGECVKQCSNGYLVTQKECLNCSPGTFYSDNQCVKCSKYCLQCTGPHPSQCQQCQDNFVLEEGKGCITNEFDIVPSFKAKQFKDPRTNSWKECNFSCDQCIDSTDLCVECNPNLKYFVKDGDRQRCYNRCPPYYEPKQTKLNPSNDFIECVISKNYESDLYAADKIIKEAESRCPEKQYWNFQTKLCNKCTNNCINCNDASSCIECEPSYYWNDNRKTCSPCHPSCQKCSGPLQNNCLSCAIGNKLFPNNNGSCGDTIPNTLPQPSILSQNEIYGNLQGCKQFLPSTQQQNYAVEFTQTFSSNDPQWKDIRMKSNEKPCTFQEFKKRYKYIKNNIQTCDDNEITQSTIEKNGDILTIYSILLTQSRAKIADSGKAVNPQTLAEYATYNSLFSSSYIFNPGPSFSCNQLQCLSQLDSLLNGFTSAESSKGITIKTLKEIVLTSTQQTPLNCFQESQLVNQNSVYEIQELVNNSKYTLKTTTKQYFILYLCGKDLQGNAVQRTMLVQKYLGNAFFEVLNVSQSQKQVETISLYGASNQQNAYLKSCNSQLSNSLSSYTVQKIRVIQVVEQDKNENKSDQMFVEYNEKVGAAKDPAKCSCVETKDYVLANENQGNNFIRVITPQNKILTQSIDAFEINHILKKYKKDANIMKANGLTISKIEAEQVFQEYIEETIQNTKKCYGISTQTPICMVNVLADLIYSSQQKCSFSNQLMNIVKKQDFNGLLNFIKKQSWCNLNNERCLKAQQTIKSCI
ncbi:hypothetical protein ABPG74_018869 [Tetrahymena malaccensis]